MTRASQPPASVVGLSCPACGGAVELREGHRVVACPYCGADALLVGDAGVFTYQVEARLAQPQARAALMRFLAQGNRASDLGEKARVEQLLLVWVPYWRVPAWVVGWRFGQRWEGSGSSSRLVRHEVRVASEHLSVHAACDVAEIGVRSVDLGQASRLSPVDREALARQGMVFAPTQSQGEALDEARERLIEQAREASPLDEVTSDHLSVAREQLELVYFPLWIARYAYRDRMYQVVIDATSGVVRYGRAPGSALYRAAALVTSMALGLAVLVSGPVILAYLLAGVDADGDAFLCACAPLGLGPGILTTGWLAYRFGGEDVHEEGP